MIKVELTSADFKVLAGRSLDLVTTIKDGIHVTRHSRSILEIEGGSRETVPKAIRVHSKAILESVRSKAMLGTVGRNEILGTVNNNAILASVDRKEILGTVNNNAILASVDRNAILASVDRNAISEEAEIMRLVSRGKTTELK